MIQLFKTWRQARATAEERKVRFDEAHRAADRAVEDLEACLSCRRARARRDRGQQSNARFFVPFMGDLS